MVTYLQFVNGKYDNSLPIRKQSSSSYFWYKIFVKRFGKKFIKKIILPI